MPATRSDALVVFGVTGDLAHKMIIPALYALVKSGALDVPVVGVAAPPWSREQLIQRVEDRVTPALDPLLPTDGDWILFHAFSFPNHLSTPTPAPREGWFMRASRQCRG